MTPDKERQARSRQKRADAGLVRLELWVHPDDLHTLKTLAAELVAIRVLAVNAARLAKRREKK